MKQEKEAIEKESENMRDFGLKLKQEKESVSELPSPRSRIEHKKLQMEYPSFEMIGGSSLKEQPLSIEGHSTNSTN